MRKAGWWWNGCVLAFLIETLPWFPMSVCSGIVGCFNPGADPCSAESWPGMELELL